MGQASYKRVAIKLLHRIGMALASALNYVSLRTGVAVLTLVLICQPFPLSIPSSIELSILSLVDKLVATPRKSAQVAIVSVPQENVASWLKDKYAADELLSLLSNILHSSQARIGLMLSERIAVENSQLDDYIQAAPDASAAIVRLSQKKHYLAELLADARVVQDGFQGPPWTLSAETREPELSLFSAYRIAKVVASLDKFLVDVSSESSAAVSQSLLGPRVALLWRHGENSLLPSFLSRLVVAETQAQHISDDQSWLRIEGKDLPVGRFLPGYPNIRDDARVINYSLDTALATNAFPPFVLIGSQSDSLKLMHAANALQSLAEERLYVIPHWSEWLVRVLLVIGGLIFCALNVLFSSGRRRVVVLMGFVSLLFLFAMFSAWYWHYALNVTIVSIYSVLVFLVVELWRYRAGLFKRRELMLMQAIDGTSILLEETKQYSLAMSLYQHYPDKHRRTLRLCHLSENLSRESGSGQTALEMLRDAASQTGNNRQLTQQIERLEKTIPADFGSDTLRQAATLKPETLGRYQLKSELGRGAVGVVYLGYDPAIDRQLAIKTFDERYFPPDQVAGLKARFVREAKAAGGLSHPNIVSVYDVGEESNIAYIAMDYAPGAALSDYIRRGKLLPVAEVYRIVHDVALALHYAHEHHVVHRDIKPGNIMFQRKPYSLKVTDFGIARLVNKAATATGEILGSPLYMSPEQLKGERVGPQSDLYSLGVSFYQLLTGQMPFNSDNLASLTYEIIHDKHKTARSVREDLPASATRITNRCLQKKPEARFGSALEMAKVLSLTIRKEFPAQLGKLAKGSGA